MKMGLAVRRQSAGDAAVAAAAAAADAAIGGKKPGPATLDVIPSAPLPQLPKSKVEPVHFVVDSSKRFYSLPEVEALNAAYRAHETEVLLEMKSEYENVLRTYTPSEVVESVQRKVQMRENHLIAQVEELTEQLDVLGEDLEAEQTETQKKTTKLVTIPA